MPTISASLHLRHPDFSALRDAPALKLPAFGFTWCTIAVHLRALNSDFRRPPILLPIISGGGVVALPSSLISAREQSSAEKAWVVFATPGEGLCPPPRIPAARFP